MKKVKDILEVIDRQLVCLSPDNFVYDALKLMDQNDIGCIVIEQDEELVGLFAERDYARKVILKGRNSWKTKLELVMRTEFPAVSRDSSIDLCMALLTEHCLRYLPVIEDTKPIALISVHDVIRQLMTDQTKRIELLESYIYSSR